MYTDQNIKCILKVLKRSLNMPLSKQLVGQVFNRLTVESREGSMNGKALWRCRCVCGKEVFTTTGSLGSGNTRSCGCYFIDRVTKHGSSHKSSYNTWRAMIRRCKVSSDKDYPNYGGRGITVCEEWNDYKTFAAEMGEPTGKETLDRIDPYGNYTPENCRWASLQTQARNMRIPKKSKTGVKGVLFHGGKYYAVITVKSKKYYSKVFSTITDAAKARKELEAAYW